MKGNLYHRDIYMPEGVRKLSGITLALRATNHAKEAASRDRYGVLLIPAAITFSGQDVIEAEFINGSLAKVVVRLPYDSRRDAIYVCTPDGTLKTVWFNMRRDKHSTLDATKYCKEKPCKAGAAC